MAVNSSDEEEEFDMEDAPKVVRKKPAPDSDGAAASKNPDSQKTPEHSEQSATAGESKQADDVRLKQSKNCG